MATVYSLLELYEDGVDAALKIEDIKLAKKIANKTLHNKKLYRKLQLKIVSELVSKKNYNGINELLKETSIVDIVDVINMLSDISSINEFKDEIYYYIDKYTLNLSQAKNEIEELKTTTTTINTHIDNFNNESFVLIEKEQCCSVCSSTLLTKPFYTFGCQHSFHTDCLIVEKTKYNKPVQSQKIKNLQKNLETKVAIYKKNTSPELQNELKEEISSLIVQLDLLVADECLLCGLDIIDSIDVPLIDLSSEEHIYWKL